MKLLVCVITPPLSITNKPILKSPTVHLSTRKNSAQRRSICLPSPGSWTWIVKALSKVRVNEVYRHIQIYFIHSSRERSRNVCFFRSNLLCMCCLYNVDLNVATHTYVLEWSVVFTYMCNCDRVHWFLFCSTILGAAMHKKFSTEDRYRSPRYACICTLYTLTLLFAAHTENPIYIFWLADIVGLHQTFPHCSTAR